MTEQIIVKGIKRRTIGYAIIILCCFILFCVLVFVSTPQYSHMPTNEAPTFYAAICFLLIGIGSGIIYFMTKYSEIIVSDKRVWGKSAFGKTVTLPLDSISSVGKTWFNGISVATSSGVIKFYMFSNAEDIYSKINDLLILRNR